MPKPRSRRKEVRDSHKRKRLDGFEDFDRTDGSSTKKARVDEDAPMSGGLGVDDLPPGPPEKEYFGFLDDEEQEVFRQIDERLKLDDFESTEDRQDNVDLAFDRSTDKELKLACSQSFSRLMERMIVLSSPAQKKKLFQKFAGHFSTLVQHRFASHICETLFIQSAPIVSEELENCASDDNGSDKDGAEPSMETLFLASLDELEEHLSFLITDRYASHVLRVLLIILSGRPISTKHTKSQLQSKKKENVASEMDGLGADLSITRPVPGIFTMAVQKIIHDSTATLDSTGLRILATHPIGNPILQLMLELDIAMSKKNDKTKGETAAESERSANLLLRMIPDAPKSLTDHGSQASQFVASLLFDPVGSHLLEVLITHCPGKFFKSIFSNVIKARLETLVKNETACYSVIRALERVNKEDLTACAYQITLLVPDLLARHRYNIITTLYQRCQARGCQAELGALTKAVSETYGRKWDCLVPKLLQLDTDVEPTKPSLPLSKSRQAILPHAATLANTMLSTGGRARKAIQSSLLALSPENLLKAATSTAPTASVLATSLGVEAEAPFFHKVLVGNLRPHILELAGSQHGHNVLNAISGVPCKAPGIDLPFHLKQSIMATLSPMEAQLRQSREGRSVWSTWKGVLFARNSVDWAVWAKEGIVDTKVLVATEGQPERPIDAARKRAAATSGAGRMYPLDEAKASAEKGHRNDDGSIPRKK